MEALPHLNRFELANRIFSDALPLSAEERQRFVRDQCASDPSLGETVLRLLSQFDRLGDFLNDPAAELPSESGSLQIDQVLCGRFRVLERLGAGGMGEVFLAEDQSLGETVALKTIRAALRQDSAVYSRFRQEIRLARRISHPNVCKIFDLFSHAQGQHGSIDFFTMQYLAGESLAAHIAKSAPLPPQEVLNIAAHIAQGLDAAHREGIIHRDLKPANIILLSAQESRPVITDFGLARLLDPGDSTSEHTLPGQIMGSIDYMAPEQFEGAIPQPATDIFALGVLIFEMLSGQRPYPSEGIVRAAVRRVTSQPPSLSATAIDVPPRWEQVIHRAMSPSPQDRYPSAQAMIEALSGPSRASTLLPRLPKSLPSRRWILTSGVLTASVAAYFAISRFKDRRPALPASPLVMLNPITHSPNDALEAGALDLTLTSQLSQSSHLRLLSPERVEHSWRVIQGAAANQAAPPMFEPRTSREIAMRSGAQVVVFGSLSRTGDERTLTLQVEVMGANPDRPRGTPWLRHFDARRAPDLASTGHDAAAWLRRTIGETEQDLEIHNRPPEELTTPYWPAFQEYAEANQAGADKPDAVALHLRTALRIDPDFAQAAARLGDLLRSEGQLDGALTYWSKAAENLERRNLTDRESLRIRGLFAADIGRHAEAEQIFARYALDYPDDSIPLLYRATELDYLGRYDEAERLHTLAIQREPLYSSIMNRCIFYLSRGRLDHAEKDWRAGRQINPFNWTDQIETAIAFARGDLHRMEAALDHLKTTGAPQARSRAFVLEACLRAEQNNVVEAEKILRSGISFDRSTGLSVASQLDKQLSLAQLLLAHHPAESIREALAALESKPGICAHMAFGAVLAQAGQIHAAEKCLAPSLPDWPVYQIATRRLEGEIALARGDLQNALRLLRQAVQPPRMRTWPEFLFRAALAAGDRGTVVETLRTLFFAPGIYWLGAEANPPGFVRAAIAAAPRFQPPNVWGTQFDFFAGLTGSTSH